MFFIESCNIIPINIKINDGQKVRNAIIPNITGFGFGSSNIPSLAHNIINNNNNNNGEHPTIKIMSPILVSLTYLRGLEIAELKEEDMPMV